MVPPRALERLPIFPLPRAHLFPGALLPLHVFEPRYRALVRDALAGDGHLAIAELQPGYEADYEGRPPVYPVCGAGELTWHEPLPDGRFNILVRGVARVRIELEHPPERAYRVVRARVLADLAPADARALDAGRTALEALVRRLAAGVPEGREALEQLLADSAAPARLADAVTAALVRDPAERRRLLEERDVARRLDRVLAALAARVAGPQSN